MFITKAFEALRLLPPQTGKVSFQIICRMTLLA
jgi:hypothetical protein